MITTYTLKTVDPLDVQLEDLNIQDIAHSLALVNRFNGHSGSPISVAQHSCYVSWLCSDEELKIQLQALLHDAAEAYLGDVTKWLKHSIPFQHFIDLEEKTDKVIFQWAGVPLQMHSAVEAADILMVKFECKKAFGMSYEIDHPRYGPLTEEEIERIQTRCVWPWTHWSWRKAEEMFLHTYQSLQIGLHAGR